MKMCGSKLFSSMKQCDEGGGVNDFLRFPPDLVNEPVIGYTEACRHLSALEAFLTYCFQRNLLVGSQMVEKVYNSVVVD